jgi:hypothetical protein
MVTFLHTFGSCVDEYRLISNGRSLPSDILLEAIKKNTDDGMGFTVLVNDYGPALSSRAEEAEHMYKSTGAIVERRGQHIDNMYLGGFVDYGVSLEMKRTGEQILQDTEKCATFSIKIRTMWDGIIYPCGRSFYYHDSLTSKTPEFPNCVLIHDNSKSTEQMRDELYKFWNKDYYDECCYCYGLSPSNRNRYPPAEQVTDTFIKENA